MRFTATNKKMPKAKKKKPTSDEKHALVAHLVAQGGWSTIYSLVSKLPKSILDDYSFLWEEEEEEDE